MFKDNKDLKDNSDSPGFIAFYKSLAYSKYPPPITMQICKEVNILTFIFTCSIFRRNENYPNPQKIPSKSLKSRLGDQKFLRFRRTRMFTFVFVKTQQRTASCVLGLAPKSAHPDALDSAAQCWC